MKLLKLWKKIGRQPFRITQVKEAVVFINDVEYPVTGLIYENGQIIGLKAVEKNCSTCANNIEYPPAHTCDICTSLDQEEEYEMWEPKKENKK